MLAEWSTIGMAQGNIDRKRQLVDSFRPGKKHRNPTHPQHNSR